MASAMAEGFFDLTPSPACGWLNPRISFSPESHSDESIAAEEKSASSSAISVAGESPARETTAEFEFRTADESPAMLSADELFSEGKIAPMQLANPPNLRSLKLDRIRKLLEKEDPPKISACSSRTSSISSIRHFLRRHGRHSDEHLPLLRDSCSFSRRSLSSSSSSAASFDEHLPRLSLDSRGRNLPRVRHEPNQAPVGGRRSAALVDSPRMNASGKVVFSGLERSSSSPGSFNGGSGVKHRVERCYSANVVRVAPVLNVPLCSLRRFGLFFGSRNGNAVGNGKKGSKNVRDC
ncbi:uncharacterized protein LOC144707933 [Wolffia australiana]